MALIGTAKRSMRIACLCGEDTCSMGSASGCDTFRTATLFYRVSRIRRTVLGICARIEWFEHTSYYFDELKKRWG